MESYTKLASYYDLLISDDDAQELYLDFTKKNMIGSAILELGCGSGILANKLWNYNPNLQITATDLSENMIQVAKDNYSNDPIQFEVMDMCKNHYDNEFDTVLCYCDSLNYVLEVEQIRQVFLGAYHSLKERGVFIFDAHSMTRLDEFKEGYDESYILDELEYSWHIHTEGSFIKQLLRVWDDSIVPTYFFEEEHVQKVYEPDLLIKMLTDIGFTVEVYTDFDIEGIVDGEKQFYVCRKG